MKPRIVFVGGGFAGLTVAKAFRHTSAEILLIDRKNHHLFQPLLYQVATAGLSPADIATPIRSVLRGQENTQVMMVEVIGIDVQKKHVLTQNRAIHYDYLIIATGSYHSYFGNDAWEHYAPGLKSIADAIEIRKRILIAFEEAEMETDYQKRQALLSFILIGGGPTGVEMAGSIAELAHQALKSDFRQIDPRLTRITLIEAGPQILFQFPLDLAVRAQKKLVDLGVELKTHFHVFQYKLYPVQRDIDVSV